MSSGCSSGVGGRVSANAFRHGDGGDRGEDMEQVGYLSQKGGLKKQTKKKCLMEPPFVSKICAKQDGVKQE